MTQVQTNLGLAGTDASAADNALSSANTLLNQLVSIAAREQAARPAAATPGDSGSTGCRALRSNW